MQSEQKQISFDDLVSTHSIKESKTSSKKKTPLIFTLFFCFFLPLFTLSLLFQLNGSIEQYQKTIDTNQKIFSQINTELNKKTFNKSYTFNYPYFSAMTMDTIPVFNLTIQYPNEKLDKIEQNFSISESGAHTYTFRVNEDVADKVIHTLKENPSLFQEFNHLNIEQNLNIINSLIASK